MLGAQSIQLGQSSVVVCGGQEAMSRVPHAILMRPGIKMGNGTLNDVMLHDGLTDAFNQYHMGITGNQLNYPYFDRLIFNEYLFLLIQLRILPKTFQSHANSRTNMLLSHNFEPN